MASTHSRRSQSGERIGYIGGVIGIIIGILYFLFASISTLVQLFHHIPVGSFVSGVLGVVFGLFSIISAGVARRDAALGGILLIVSAVLGFYFIDGLYVISSIIVLIAGLIAIVDYVR